MVTCMLRPDLFGGMADHAGDAVFENCYLPDFRKCARVLRDRYEGSYDRFWADFRSRPAMSRDGDGELANAWAMAAAYSADSDGTVRLPFDTATGMLIPEVWEQWLQWDPVRMAPRYADALRSLRAIFIDGGRTDEWYLDLGGEAFRRALEQIGVTDVRFELLRGRPHVDRVPVPDRAALPRGASVARRPLSRAVHAGEGAGVGQLALYPKRRSICLRSAISTSPSTPRLRTPSATPRMARPWSVSATMTSTGLAVAQ